MPPRQPLTSPQKDASGQGGPVYLAVGQLRRPHGVRGEILMTVLTDFPERIKPKKRLFVGDQYEPLVVSSLRDHADGMLISFHGFDTPEAVGRFRNQYVFVAAADVPPLPDGEYYHHQLIGLQVLSESDEHLGTLTEILETGANDVYVVTDDTGKEILLPAIPAVILDIDVERGQMRVHLLPGLRGEE
jgi:16S rRNA processing protein RimM